MDAGWCRASTSCLISCLMGCMVSILCCLVICRECRVSCRELSVCVMYSPQEEEGVGSCSWWAS
jgi:hypothetical protein